MQPDVLRSRKLLSTTLHSLGNTAKSFARGMEEGTLLILQHERSRDAFLAAFRQYEGQLENTVLHDIYYLLLQEGNNQVTRKQAFQRLQEIELKLRELLKRGLVLTETKL